MQSVAFQLGVGFLLVLLLSYTVLSLIVVPEADALIRTFYVKVV